MECQRLFCHGQFLQKKTPPLGWHLALLLSISSVANRMGTNGRFLRLVSEWELPVVGPSGLLTLFRNNPTLVFG
jgi:hypothetical protein